MHFPLVFSLRQGPCQPKVSKEQMEESKTRVCVSMDFELVPTRAFEVFIEELATALRQAGMDLEAGPNGRVVQGDFEVGRIVEWLPGELIGLQWHQADWNPEEVTEVEMRLEPIDGGTLLSLSHRGWGGLIGARRLWELADRPKGSSSVGRAGACRLPRPALPLSQLPCDSGGTAPFPSRLSHRSGLWGRRVSRGGTQERMPCGSG